MTVSIRVLGKWQKKTLSVFSRDHANWQQRNLKQQEILQNLENIFYQIHFPKLKHKQISFGSHKIIEMKDMINGDEKEARALFG